MAAALVAASLVGTMEWLVARPWSAGWAALLPSWLAFVSVWGLAAGAYALLETAVLRASLGLAGADEAGRRLWGASVRAWRLRHAEDEPERVGRLCGVLLALSLWLGLSVVFTAQLIEHRHGALLIALTAVTAQLVFACVAWLVAGACARAVSGVLRSAGGRLRFVHVPGVIASVGLLAIAAVTWAVLRFHVVLEQTDAMALLWPVLFVGLNWLVVHGLSPERERRHLVAWLLWAACVPVLSGALGSGSARVVVMRQSDSSKYAIKQLMNASDVDRDGAASYPISTDCAPFDERRHPMATEQPGNGIDENCDGEDRLTIFNSRLPVEVEPPSGPLPNIVLITFDATRADHLGFMGYQRDTSPHLDALAKRSAVFTRAFSADSGTGPSFWSMHAGKTPFQVELFDAGKFPPRIHRSEKLLASRLRDGGYHTEAVMCGSVFSSPRFDIRRGFVRFRNVCSAAEPDEAQRTADAAIQMLDELPEPFFLWVHFYDPHGPYKHVTEFDFGSRPVDRYDSEIRNADEHAGRLLAHLNEASGRPTYVIFTADHGENFGSHGRDPHARNLYRVVTHVPLLFHGPGVQPRRVDVPVASNDIFPTVLQLARRPASRESTMVSQLPVLLGHEPDASRIVFQENSYSRPRRHTKGAVRGNYHFILDLTMGVEELYDYVRDPVEKENLIGRGLPAETELRSALGQFLTTTDVPDELSQ